MEKLLFVYFFECGRMLCDEFMEYLIEDRNKIKN